MQIPEYPERDELLVRLNFSSYELYLQSDLWQSIKLRAYRVHGRRCKICGNDADVLHHKNYRWEVMSGKSLKGLVPLCRDCHKVMEFSRTGWKRTLDGTNNKLAELTSSHATKSQQRIPDPKSQTPHQLRLRRRKSHTHVKMKKKPRPMVCKTRGQVLAREEKLAENLRNMTASQGQVGSSPLSRFL